MITDLQSIADDDGTCGYCNGACERLAVERFETIGWVPVSVRKRMVVTCRQCRRVSVLPLNPPMLGQLPRSPGALRRVVMTWLWFAVAVLGVFLGVYWNDQINREQAIAPIVDDRWTIKSEEWAAQTESYAFENAQKYGVVKVVGVGDEEIELAACDVTFDKESDASKHCKTFRIELDPVSRAEIPALFDDDAIAGVKRAGETFFYWCAGGFAAYFLLLVLHGWLTRRYLAGRSSAKQA